MNQFYIDSLKKVGISEGGYANDKDDTGEETYAGFSRVHNPDLKMWKIIDQLKKEVPSLKTSAGVNALNKKLAMLPVVQDEIKLAYKKRYWDPIQLDYVTSKELAHQIFDHAVNAGVSAAIRLAEELVGMKPTGKYSSELLVKLKRYGME